MTWTGSLALLAPETTELNTLSEVVWAKKRPIVFQKLSFPYAVLPTTQLKSVPIRILFLRSNPFSMKPGSSGVLKYFFFKWRWKKKNQQHKLHFQQIGARVYFLVFPFPEEHSFSILQLPDSTRNAQTWDLCSLCPNCILLYMSSDGSICLLGMRKMIKLCSQTNYIWPRFWFLFCLIGTLRQQGVNLGSATRGFRLTALTQVMGIKGLNPSVLLWKSTSYSQF